MLMCIFCVRSCMGLGAHTGRISISLCSCSTLSISPVIYSGPVCLFCIAVLQKSPKNNVVMVGSIKLQINQQWTVSD